MSDACTAPATPLDNLLGLREQHEQQQAPQRAEERHDQEEEAETREDRERRGGGSGASAGFTFAVGNKVLHDLLGEAVVRKLARIEDPDHKLNIEWSRPGKTKKDAPVIHNRWVLPSSLTKITTTASSDRCEPEKQQGLFGAMPDMAAHERERKRKMKLPEGPRGRQVEARTTKETKVSVEQRLREFPGQGLRNSAGVVFCAPCKEQLPNIKGSIKDHVSRRKHTNNLKQHVEKHGDDEEVKELLSEHFKMNSDESGSRCSDEEHLYRYRVVETFIGTGTPLARINDFRPVLERGGIALTDRAQMSTVYIPRISARENGFLALEMGDSYMGIHFDGTTRLGEAICLTGRVCSSEFELKTRLLSFMTTEKHTDAPQLASVLTARLGKLGISPDRVVNTSRDSASTNGAACNLMLANPLINAANTLCIAHTISNAGAHIVLPTLAEFTTPWLELVGGRDPHQAAKKLWQSMVAPQVVPGYSKVRWWSKAEIWFVMAENFSKLQPFVRLLRDRGIGDATTMKMTSLLRDRTAALQLELAAMLDVRVLVRTTYALEGDRLEVLLVYRRIEELRALGRALAANQDGVLPNVDAVLRATAKLENGLVISKPFPGHGSFQAKVISSEQCESTLYAGKVRTAYRVRFPSDGMEEDLEEEEIRSLIVTLDMPERKRMAEALAKGFEYLETRITGTCDEIYDCSAMYNLCRLVQVFDPAFAATHANDLVTIKPLGALADITKMKAQLPAYLTRAAGFTADISDVEGFSSSVLEWWRRNTTADISAWADAAQIVFAISPNSASCERVFALLKHMFGDGQMASLADYMQAALMLAYNDRKIG
eukprot:CAMPEP_0181246642 /NCGR_PEP_ID=MMETSP1096-20121128/44115_1 /TAXON_ID=156174 ORGANISM="Chrysochromulina ericina, Strain CCMP281" /NCGR_SAMPLE_ID=MMETSP1096 /ASSEMBLY_ACC=CAM_ASM_000453 /LENGTH=829 /DNA_ID=CAMNT_0023343497 /DNA_START=868 /DNA_END=3357 /DNA_ORIENTATION=+